MGNTHICFNPGWVPIVAYIQFSSCLSLSCATRRRVRLPSEGNEVGFGLSNGNTEKTEQQGVSETVRLAVRRLAGIPDIQKYSDKTGPETIEETCQYIEHCAEPE